MCGIKDIQWKVKFWSSGKLHVYLKITWFSSFRRRAETLFNFMLKYESLKIYWKWLQLEREYKIYSNQWKNNFGQKKDKNHTIVANSK